MAIIEEAERAKEKQVQQRMEVKAPTEEETGRELANDISAMAGSDDFADLTIICRDNTAIKCNKFLIAARSEVSLVCKNL